MGNIVGTTISVKNFVSKAKHDFEAKTGFKGFDLEENRKYYVPFYQREIRWRKENIIHLLSDIKNGSVFLGNIILSKIKETKDCYEIIDGQQRITAILMILHYYENNKLYKQKIDSCQFNVMTFGGFNDFMKANFIISKVDEKVLLTDVLYQALTYQELYECVISFFKDNKTKEAHEKFYKNLELSEFIITISKDENENEGLNYFLDVNLKALPLDSEDIFKSYYFKVANNSIKDAILNWNELKKAHHLFEISYKDVCSTKTQFLMLFLEYCYRCRQHLIKDYLKISFDSNFKLSDKYQVKSLGTGYKGDHLLYYLRDHDYSNTNILFTTKLFSLFSDIIGTDKPSSTFKKTIRINGKTPSDETIDIIHFQIKTVLLGNDELPKMLIIKYFLEVVFDDKKTKETVKYMFGVFVLSVLFSVFDSGTRKKMEVLLDIAKASKKDWYLLLHSKSLTYFSKTNLDSKLNRYTIPDPLSRNNYLSRSLAGLYNYYSFKNSKISITNEKMASKFYYTKNDDYSTEHFILNDSKTYVVEIDGKLEKIPVKLSAKLVNSIFNFIFIPKTVNDKLGNFPLCEKIRILELPENYSEIKCEYSKHVIDLVKKRILPSFPTFKQKSIEQANKNFEFYFGENGGFDDAYSELYNDIYNLVKDKIS